VRIPSSCAIPSWIDRGSSRSRLALGLTLLVGAASAEPLVQLPQIDQIVLRKAVRTRKLTVKGRRVRTITGLQLGRMPAAQAL
jgi:hypothetical protein